MDKKKLEALVKDMSLKEKMYQLVQLHGGFVDCGGVLTGPEAAFRPENGEAYWLGSILSVNGAKTLRGLQDKIMENQPHHIPALFMSDVIHGYRTIFPAPIAQGCSFDPKLIERISEAAAKEASAAGIHVTFAPMADLVRDSRWGRCMESTGEDPWLNSRYAESSVKGFQGENVSEKGRVAACVKHFAAYGAAVAGRDYNVTELSERTLRGDYLPAYKAAADAGAELVMTAFNTIDRIPCTVNAKLMRDLLRGEWGFGGVLITDYNAVGETMAHGVSEDRKSAALKAMRAGCDIDMMSDCYLKELENLVSGGELPEALIDEAVLRVLELKNKLGLFENPYKDASEEAEKELLYCEEHMRLSREAAEECIVLLKNNGILPLKRGGRIAVVGALADSADILGTWAIFAEKERTVTFRAALEQLYPDVSFEFFPTDGIDEEALAAVRGADAVIAALGEGEIMTGESRSRAEIVLPEKQRELFGRLREANENIVSVLFAGRPLAVPELAEGSAALIMAWLPGTCGTLALSDIIFGKVNPSGKLSMSFPYCTGQLPISYSGFSTGRPAHDKLHFVPYRSSYMDAPIIPLYSFGEGLSYTSFEYSPVSLSNAELSRGGKITASVTVKNAGGTDGKEAVQLYIRDISGSTVRPLKELKGVRKISLRAGESADVSFDITEDMLKFYDIDMNYTAEAGSFTVWIGGSSLTENSAEFRLV